MRRAIVVAVLCVVAGCGETRRIVKTTNAVVHLSAGAAGESWVVFRKTTAVSYATMNLKGDVVFVSTPRLDQHDAVWLCVRGAVRPACFEATFGRRAKVPPPAPVKPAAPADSDVDVGDLSR